MQDLGSTNGTLVNGTREHRKALAHGDELRMGKLVLKVSLDAVAAREPVQCLIPLRRRTRTSSR